MTDADGEPLTEEGRFTLLVDSVTDYAIYMLDPTGKVVSWNAGARRFKGYQDAEIIGEHFSRFYTEEDKAAGIPRRALAEAEHEGRFEAEGWRVRKDGTRFWANVVIDPVRDRSGRLVGFAKVTRDLTERKLADEALRQSEERFRLLVQSVTDYAIYMLDPTGRVVSWNPGAQRFKGYADHEIIGQHFARFYTDEDREAGVPARAITTARDTGRFEAEGWRVRKDGTRFWASVVIDPVRDTMGNLIGFAKITRDLTERRDAQLALERAREAFFQSQKMDALGKLTGGVAHDFNNLLAVVIGSLDLARRRLADGGDIGRFIDNAMQAAERGATLTQRMLAFARRQELALQSVDVAALVAGMTELLDRTIGTAIAIETRFAPDLPSVRGDPGQLELAILNLTVNARDAMPEGGRIVIAADQPEEGMPAPLAPGRYVRVSVSDTGHGMDEATRARAMEPFYTTKGVGKGTGLGLSMVHGLAEQSGGVLELASRVGEGTTVSLWLPMAEAKAAAEPNRAPASPDTAPPSTGRVVLAVDDDRLVLLNTVAMLQELGHRVLEAASGAEALAVLEREPVDAVVTDFAMPEMSGIDLAGHVQARWPRVPVILASGFAELPPGSACLLPRIAKPFRADALAAALRDLPVISSEVPSAR